MLFLGLVVILVSVAISTASVPRLDLIHVAECASSANKYASLAAGDSTYDSDVSWTPELNIVDDNVVMKPDPDMGPGCYRVKVKMHASQTVGPPLQSNVTMRFGGIQAPALDCYRAPGLENTCTGVGSCMVCNVCERMKNLSLSTTDGDVAKCPIQAGRATIAHSFCMPDSNTFNQVLTSGMKKVLKDKADQDGKVSDTIWVKIEVYDQDIFGMCGAQWNCDLNKVRRTKIGCYYLGFNIQFNANDIVV